MLEKREADFALGLGIAWSENFGLRVFNQGLYSLEDLFKDRSVYLFTKNTLFVSLHMSSVGHQVMAHIFTKIATWNTASFSLNTCYYPKQF